MDAFRYIEVHKDEESPANMLHEAFSEINKTNPDIIDGIHELYTSGVLETPEVQAKMGDMWKSWENEVND